MNTYKPDIEEHVSIESIFKGEYKLILHNDDYHTFDYVIDSLVAICGHSPEQAEQCAHIVHYKGRCDVKRGPLKIVEKLHGYLAAKDLLVSVE